MNFDKILVQTLKECNLDGLAKGKSIQDIAKKHDVDIKTIQDALQKGIKVEMEHTNDKDVAKLIALDHLFELGPNYYKELSKMESKLKESANIAGAGGTFGPSSDIGTHGGSIGNNDFYAPGDARVVQGSGIAPWLDELRKKTKKGKKKIKKGFPMYRRTLVKGL